MTPTLMGRLQTRIFLAATVGVLWTAAITPGLPRPAGMSSAFAYHVTFEALGLMTLLGLGWEAVYHVMQQARWDKDWPSMFALLAVIPEAIPLWYVTHILDVIPGTTRLSSPIIPLYVIHVSTTWVLTWLFMQGPLRVLHLRWRFEGGKVLVRAPGRLRRRPSGWPGLAGAAAAPVAGPAEPAAAAGTVVAASGTVAAAARGTGAGPGDSATAGPSAAGNLAEGVLCRHGHFSHPDARYCVICGSAVVPLAGAGALGPPPPAGILILPDGGTRVLDHDLTVTASAASGDLGFLPLGEHPQAVAHIRIVGWQPVVTSPACAMSLFLPGGSQLRAEPSVPVPLVPGAELAVGGHRLRYESPHQAGPLNPAPGMATDRPRRDAVPGPVPVPRRVGPAARRRWHAAAPVAAATAAVVALPELAASRMAAAGRVAWGWLTGQPGRGTQRAVVAGAATAAVVTALMLGFAGRLADRHGGTGPLATGPGRSPSSSTATPGTRPSPTRNGPASSTSPTRNGPASSTSPASYTLAVPGARGRPGRPVHQGPAGIPGPPSSSPGPAPARTRSPSPSPSPTRTRPPMPGFCLSLLGLRICGLL